MKGCSQQSLVGLRYPEKVVATGTGADREGHDEAKVQFLMAEAEFELPGRGSGSFGEQSIGSQGRGTDRGRGTGADRCSGKQGLSRQTPWQGA